MRARSESQEKSGLLFVATLWAALALAFLILAVPARAETGLAYTVEIHGVEDGSLRTLLRQSSQLVALADNPPATVTGIRRRAGGDLDRLAAALRSEGYYGAEVSYRVDGTGAPVRVHIDVTPGPRFRLRTFDISYDGEVEGGFPTGVDDLADARGQPATGRYVLALQARVIDQLHDNGYPFAELGDRIAEAHMEDGQLDVRLTIVPGPRARFGETVIDNPTRARDQYVRDRVTWQPGEPFNRQALRDVHAALEETGIFSNVSVEPAATPHPDGTLDVTISVEERAPRTIGAGVRYGTSDGAGAHVFWEHRNLWGRAERLRLEAELSEIRQTASVQLRQARFRRPDQDLLTSLAIFNEVAESYDETGVSASIGLARRLTSNLTAQAGIEGRVSVVDEGDVRRDTRLVRVPVGFSYNSTDNVLDPTEGFRVSLSFAPTAGTSETDLLYATTEVHAAAYHAIDNNDRVVVALRARLGMVAGEANLDLPASERFYSGGGGSVRGIGYQLAGPVDADRDPIGGRSVVEVGAEARIRVTDRIGIVPFVEGGTVFTSDVPDFSEDLHWGAGIGLRYYTAFGPVRLDVATPLNRREGIDDVVQVYISLGQAF